MTLGSTNSDFETGTLAGWATTDEIEPGSTGLISVTTSAARSGSYGCRMYGSGSADYWRLTLESTTFDTDFDEISIYVQLAQTSGNVQMYGMICAYTSDATETMIPIGASSTAITPSTNWTQFTFAKDDITPGDYSAEWGETTYFTLNIENY